MKTDFSKRLLKRDDNNIVDFADKIVCTGREEYLKEFDIRNDMVYQKLCDLEDIIDNHDLDFKKRGKWIYTEKGCVITCSYCGERLELCYPDGTEIRWSKHCPSCGALMDEINN